MILKNIYINKETFAKSIFVNRLQYSNKIPQTKVDPDFNLLRALA